MVPDIIINPNAFPSRMTIGMLCESMAGKAGTSSSFLLLPSQEWMQKSISLEYEPSSEPLHISVK